MTIIDPKNIRHANHASHFNSGDLYEKQAQETMGQFDQEFPEDGMNPEQIKYIVERRAAWAKFITSHFNDVCYRRGEWMPAYVCGPANYPVAKMEKRFKRLMSVEAEFVEKKKRFLKNTHKQLEFLNPADATVAEIRAGKWENGKVIKSDDPHFREKLTARIEYLKEHHEHMKAENAKSRKAKEKAPFERFLLTNNNANIRAMEKRLALWEREKKNPSVVGWDFEGGKVVANNEEKRLQILFDHKPEREMIEKLKKAAFRWSPRNTAWQRQLTANAVWSAKAVVGGG